MRDNIPGLCIVLSREIRSMTGITIPETGIPGRGVRFGLLVAVGECRFAGSPARCSEPGYYLSQKNQRRQMHTAAKPIRNHHVFHTG